MNKAVLIIIFSIGWGCLQAQECLNVNFKLRGYFYAGTSQVDSTALGGFYEDNNKPRITNETINQLTEPSKFQLLVKTDSIALLPNGIQGFKVFLVNRTDSIIELEAQDSRLYLKRQVFYKNQWQDVEYLPDSWCGNSYHLVIIRQGEYWDFTAPCLTGKLEARFRFALALNKEEQIYSNEFSGSFNKPQLKREQGYDPISIMDPYDN